MKKTTQLLLTTILVVCLIGLGALAQEDRESSEEISSRVEVKGWKYVTDISDQLLETTEFESEPPYKIGYVTIFMANNWSVQMKREIMVEAEKHPDKVDEIIHLNAQSEISEQISAVEDLVAQGVDAIVIDPISPEALSGVLKMAQEEGVPVIGISSPIPVENVTAWVGRDDVEYGRVIAKRLAEQLNYEGNVVALSGIAGNPVSARRWEGAKQVFDKYDDIEILTREFAQWGFAQGKSAMSSILAGYSDIDAVWSGGGAMTQGAIEAFLDEGRDLVPMTGEANNGFMLDWVEYADQGFESIAFNNPTSHSAIGLRLALKALNGEPIPKKVNVTAPYILTVEEAKKLSDSDLADGYWAGTMLDEEEIEELWGE